MPQHLEVEFAPDEFVDERGGALLVRGRLCFRARATAFAQHFADGEQAVPEILRKARGAVLTWQVAFLAVEENGTVEKSREPLARRCLAGFDDLGTARETPVGGSREWSLATFGGTEIRATLWPGAGSGSWLHARA